VPDVWRTANVMPIKIKNKIVKSDPVNYRPVSPTSVCIKLFVSIFRDLLMEHFFCRAGHWSSENGLMNRQCRMVPSFFTYHSTMSVPAPIF
jgi:hypothetical protein